MDELSAESAEVRREGDQRGFQGVRGEMVKEGRHRQEEDGAEWKTKRG